MLPPPLRPLVFFRSWLRFQTRAPVRVPALGGPGDESPDPLPALSSVARATRPRALPAASRASGVATSGRDHGATGRALELSTMRSASMRCRRSKPKLRTPTCLLGTAGAEDRGPSHISKYLRRSLLRLHLGCGVLWGVATFGTVPPRRIDRRPCRTDVAIGAAVSLLPRSVRVRLRSSTRPQTAKP